MTCDELAPFLVDLARGADLPADVRGWAAAHAAGCPACGRRLEDERVLSAALRGLATDDEAAQAPAWIEARLRGALHQAQPSPAPAAPRRPRESWGWALAAAIAASLSAAALVWRREPSPPPTPEWARDAVEGEDEAFLPVTFDDALSGLDAVQVVRMRLPRSAIGRMGLPLSNDPGQGPVEADVLVGQDGLPRAIRLVSAGPEALSEGSGGNE
jgi:hypothetical protein